MLRVRSIALVTVLAVGGIVSAPATAMASCEDEGTCVIERPICRESVPKIVRAAAGCFSDIQP